MFPGKVRRDQGKLTRDFGPPEAPLRFLSPIVKPELFTHVHYSLVHGQYLGELDCSYAYNACTANRCFHHQNDKGRYIKAQSQACVPSPLTSPPNS